MVRVRFRARFSHAEIKEMYMYTGSGVICHGIVVEKILG